MSAVRALALVVAILVCSLPAWAGKHTPEQIQQAIKELSDRNFNVREKASRILWEAGADAEEPLRAALKSSDAETARRAKVLLEKFEWGIFPDTPAAVVELINRYRDGDRNVRLQVVPKLLGLGQPGYLVLKRLAAKETNETERQAIYSQMAANAQRGVPGLLVAGDWAGVEDLLDRCLLSDTEAAYTNYAAHHYLRGSVDPALAKAMAEWNKTKSKPSGMLVVHLYRVKSDFAKARAVAQEMGNEALVESLLWEASDWRGLAERVAREGLSPREGSEMGKKAAYARLAGDRSIFTKAVDELQKLAESEDRFEVRSACDALLLNGKYADALKILIDRKKNVPLAFDLLVARLQFQEAFALAREAQLLDKDEQFMLDLHRARALFQLGEKGEAQQILERLGGSLKEVGEMTSARDLVKALVRLGLPEQAGEQAARYLALIQKQGVIEGFAEVLEPLFGTDKDSAEAWWIFLRSQSGDEEPGKTMQALRNLWAGKPVEKRNEWAKALVEQTAPLGPVPVDPLAPEASPRPNPALAAAIVMQRAGNDKKAEEYLNKAASVRPVSATLVYLGDFLYAKNRFKEAASAYERAATVDSGNPLPQFLRGWALKQSGDAKEGARLMDLAHWIPLGSEQDRGEFAKQLDRRGFPDDAKRERDLVLVTGWYRYWHVGNVVDDAGRLALRQKNYAKAIAMFEKSIAGSMRTNAKFIDNQAYLTGPQSVVQAVIRQLLAENKIDQALAAIRAHLDALPGNFDIVIVVVPVLEKAGRKKEADELYEAMRGRFEKLSETYPNSGFAHNLCAWLAVNCRRDSDKAFEHAQKAVSLSPKGADYLDTLSEIYFRRGDIAKATDTMKKCVELDPNYRYYRKQLERFAKGDTSSEVPETDDD